MGLFAAKLSVILLIALAPMLCIRFCEVRHAVEHQLSTDPHYLHHSAHTHEPNAPDHAPLEDVQQIVQAITDALPTALAAAAPILMLIALVSTCAPRLQRLAFAPPTPPPKTAA